MELYIYIFKILFFQIGRYEEFNNLKSVNPNLKTLLAVGGRILNNKIKNDILYLILTTNKVGIWARNHFRTCLEVKHIVFRLLQVLLDF